MTAVATPVAVTLDCPDPQALAGFYQQVTGWEIIWSDENAAYLAGEGSMRLGFARVEDFTAPEWPKGSVPQQSHLDFSVEDLDAAEKALVELGATKAEHQPGSEYWRVLLDPAGHPFCVTVAA